MMRKIFCGKSSVENHLKIRCGFITMLVAVVLNVATVYAAGGIEWERDEEEMYGGRHEMRGKCHVVLAKRALMKYHFESDGYYGTASLCVNGDEVLCELAVWGWEYGINVDESLVLDPGTYDITYDFDFNCWEDPGDSSGSCGVDIVDFSDKEPYQHGVKILSSKIRENDPTVMDVRYVVYSDKPTVKVRALAFEDGERSFGKVVRPETFIDGTVSNIGDAITPNVEHELSWRVSSDWSAKLAKVKFEVLACVGDVLPLELMTIPASDRYGAMKVSWNKISDAQCFEALLWLYADKDAGLTLTNGQLKNGNTVLAKNAQIVGEETYWDENGNFVGLHTVGGPNVPQYILHKMGYSLLAGDELIYVNQETRLGLNPSGARQYAYKIIGK